MPVEPVGLIPACVECGDAWLPDDQCWRAYLDTDDEIAFYCAECAEREFGEPST